MTPVKQFDLRFSERSRVEAIAAAQKNSERWSRLCDKYLPFRSESIWCSSRLRKPDEPPQGWKLHISATVIQACDLFQAVAPFLTSRGVLFKAPESLKELVKINSGLDYGYCQVGKVFTIYPSTDEEAISLAHDLHNLTNEFIAITVPFDNQYRRNSSVFYRYGAFTGVLSYDRNNLMPTIENSLGDSVVDDRYVAVPEWLSDPFQADSDLAGNGQEVGETPLTTTYRVFAAITQRGKGGTYKAVDLGAGSPRLCVVKQGRRHGEVFWNNQDGYDLVEYEKNVLSTIGGAYQAVPRVYSSFESDGDFYLVIEYVEGKSLQDLIRFRTRRLPVRQILTIALGIGRIIAGIYKAGWVWNDCKPANLIVSKGNLLRPVDFENAYALDRSARFDWRSYGFSRSPKNESPRISPDWYAMGTVVYFLLTGVYYDAVAPVSISRLRKNVPTEVVELVESLLNDRYADDETVGDEVERVLSVALGPA